MAVNILSAAKYAGNCSGWQLSNLRMQKILYIAHMYSLGMKQVPLVEGSFEAWDFGPVHPDLYHKAKIFGADPVKNIFRSVDDLDDDGQDAEIIKRTVEGLARFSGAKLVGATHWEEGAWYKNYIPGAYGVVIPNQDILKEYRLREEQYSEKQHDERL